MAAVADDVAYNHHDLHDGLRAGLFTEDDLAELPVIGPGLCRGRPPVSRPGPHAAPLRGAAPRLRRHGRGCDRRCQNRLAGLQPRSADDIRAMDGAIIRFSKPLYQNIKAIKSFLFQRMYRAPSVVVERTHVTQMLNDLFPLYWIIRPPARPVARRGHAPERSDRTRASCAGLRRRDDRPLCDCGTSTPDSATVLNLGWCCRVGRATLTKEKDGSHDYPHRIG